MSFKVVIVAGGTGGHLFPGLAVAGKLKSDKRVTEIVFAGGKKTWVKETVLKEGFRFFSISAGGWLGKSPVRKVYSAVQVLKGLLQSLRVLRKISPQVVLGMGGYVSGSFLMAACILRIPTIIHEQNLVPGMTNRWLGKFVKEVNVSFSESSRFFPAGKVKVTGNPVREQVLKACERAGGERQNESDKKTILVMGGSQGAYQLNLVFAEAINYLKTDIGSWCIVHLSGKDDYEFMVQAYEQAGVKVEVYPFRYDIEKIYREAGLVIARAGATTLAEITVCGLPAVLIPYPLATHNHQEENARWLEKQGAAVVLTEPELDGRIFAETVISLISDDNKLFRMAESSKKAGNQQAAETVAARVMAVAMRENNQ